MLTACIPRALSAPRPSFREGCCLPCAGFSSPPLPCPLSALSDPCHLYRHLASLPSLPKYTSALSLSPTPISVSLPSLSLPVSLPYLSVWLSVPVRFLLPPSPRPYAHDKLLLFFPFKCLLLWDSPLTFPGRSNGGSTGPSVSRTGCGAPGIGALCSPGLSSAQSLVLAGMVGMLGEHWA